MKTNETRQFSAIADKMKRHGIADNVIENFRYYYQKLLDQKHAMMPETNITPVTTLAEFTELPRKTYEHIGQKALEQTVAVKLNGGLGTSMGMTQPKGLLKAKSGMRFIDIALRQHQTLTVAVPVIFMNSFNTNQETCQALSLSSNYHEGDLPCCFLQHKVPKIDAATLGPVRYPENPHLEWCPPGHGNVYSALYTSGVLSKLLDQGYRYAFFSNIDNLGAVVDPVILGYMIENNLSFLIETARRTRRDKKGGHLAYSKNGGYVMREIAQCPEKDVACFQDIKRHRFFNTNNIWVDLASLDQVLDECSGILSLPMIVNEKPVNPRDHESATVFQLETAMGGAISVFDRAGAINVPRERFIPVKNTGDLLVVRSDRYLLTEDYRLVLNPDTDPDDIQVELDPSYYQFFDELEKRFPMGAPSLVNCRSFSVHGDFRFKERVRLKDNVTLINPYNRPFWIEGNQELKGDSAVVN